MARRFQANHDRSVVSYVRLGRIARDMSQQDLADASDLSQVAISHIESGRRQPRRSTQRLLSDALGYSKEELFPENGRSPSKELRELARKDARS